MKRILLLMWVLLLGISIQAQTTKEITVSSTNTLASQIASIGNCDYLIIKGELTEDDVAALSNITSNVKHILMNQATLTEEAEEAEFTFNNSNVETIVLPKDLWKVNPDWFENCSNLKSAISYSTDGKKLKAHIAQAGTLKDAVASLTLGATGETVTDLGTWTSWNNCFSNNSCRVENATITGEFNDTDLGGQWNSTLVSNKMKNLDLGDATGNIGTMFSNNSSVIESIVLPQGTTSLSEGAFKTCTNLTNVTLPEALTTIPANCFLDCSSLEEISIPSSVTTVGAHAFERCSAMKTLIIGSGVTSIGEDAFKDCSSLETIEFEKGTTTLDFAKGVFARSKSLKHVVFPEGLKNIGDGMFDQCSNLMSVRLPNSLEYIGKEAFKECTSMSYLTIPANVKTIGEDAFAQSGIKDIYLMAQTVEKLPFIHQNAFGDTPFTGNKSLAIDIDVFADRLKLLISRGQIEGYDKDNPDIVDTWKTGGNYGSMTDAYDQKVLALLPTEEVEDVYRDLFINKPSIAYLHYPKVDADGNPTELSNFIDGNPWKGQTGLLDDLGGFYSQGQHWDGGNRDWYRPIDEESPRLAAADHLTEAYGIGPDAAGKYWPDTNHADGTHRADYGNPSSTINATDPYQATATITSTYNPIQNPDYVEVGYSKYYWRNFLLQSGYSPNNDEVYSKYYDDTWYTMCFPFDLTDEQLEAAYQSNKFNICEFSGAAILPSKKKNNQGEDVDVQNLVLCFTKIARTWYKDKYGNYYKRTRDNDQNQTKHYYQAKRTWVERTDGTSDWDLTNVSTTEYTRTSDNADIWDSIDGILAIAGHPYMIHPYHVEEPNTGKATLCTIPKVVYKYDFNRRGTMEPDKLADTMNKMAAMYNSEAVTRPICTITDTEHLFEKDQDGVTQGDGKTENYGRYNDMTATTLGNYTFKGTYFPKKGDEIAAGEQTEKVIPYGAYFLGVKASVDPKYPKFFREISTDQNRTKGLWKQYTAIIIPDEGATSWQNKYLTGPTQTIQTGAKGISMLFGDFEDIVDENVIQGIATEAERMGLEVKRTDIIVNINGQILRPGAGVEGLPKGIYVINGKKYLVK